jgi:hypothetical protein
MEPEYAEIRKEKDVLSRQVTASIEIELTNYFVYVR